MIYGTLSLAKQYDKEGKIDEWMQDFLRADGKNLALADGLLLEERYYFGLREIPITLLSDVKSGTPEYLHAANDIQYFFEVVDRMKDSLANEWDAPPLIVEYVYGKFKVDDGRHRLETYRQLGVERVWAAVWTTGEENRKTVEKILEDNK
ncbi:MAG: ParB N-terminal domain-containing protein [Lachnospiraceae bacterium]|nr:ParB N-terminal domain-containing protein [Lachnospiraceae bacterium]